MVRNFRIKNCCLSVQQVGFAETVALSANLISSCVFGCVGTACSRAHFRFHLLILTLPFFSSTV